MTKEAMISPQEERQYQTGWEPNPVEGKPPYPIMDGNGWRVAQVVSVGQTFPMGEPIFWTECADEIEQDLFVYNPDDGQFYPVTLPLPV